MKQLILHLAPGLGEIIYVHSLLENEKHKYNKIIINIQYDLLKEYTTETIKEFNSYKRFFNDFCNALFVDNKYQIIEKRLYKKNKRQTITNLWKKNKFKLTKPSLVKELCHGSSLNIKNYIVITTKAREFSIHKYNLLKKDFYKILEKLSQKYKIIILGERDVEMTKEYLIHGKNFIYSIYADIIENINNSNLIDLSIPRLGKTVSTLKQLQQDCLIMNEAQFVVSFGIGGNFCLSSAVANCINMNSKSNDIMKYLYVDNKYSSIFTTSNTDEFLFRLRKLIDI